MIEPLVYLNDQTLPASEAHLAIYDKGVVLGATVTEMVRTYHHRLFRLEDHLQRLYRSLNYVGFDIRMSTGEFGEHLEALTEHNVSLIRAEDDLGLVVFVTAGEIEKYAAHEGLKVHAGPTVCAHTFPIDFESLADKLQHGVQLVTPSIRHVPPQCYDPNMKYRSRMHYYLADQQAQLVNPDAIALLLDLDGNVTETSGANFLIVEGNTIVSPTLRNILPGISRSFIRELACELKLEFVERDFQVFHAVNADEALLSSTPYGIMPVSTINGHTIGSGARGPVTQKLIDAWSERVGLDIEEQIMEGSRRLV